MSGLLDSVFQIERESFYQHNEIIPEDMWRKRLVRLGYTPEEITLIYNSGYFDMDEKMYNFVPDKNKKHEFDLHTVVRFMAFDDNVVIGFSKISSKQKILYSVNNGEYWLEATPSTKIVIEKAGDVVGFRGKFNGEIEDAADITTFTCTKGNVGVDGNLNAMFDWENVDSVKLTPFCAAGLFKGCSGIKYVYNLEMPANQLAEYCYKEMFAGCTQITVSPVLPAMKLATGCYNMMFANCTALEVAPELPAEVMADMCYSNMFSGCTAIVDTPVLNSTELAEYCYTGMFNGCSALVNVPELPAEELAVACYKGMFMNCTSLEVAPVLNAEVLEGDCYQYMFSGCSNLARIECFATDISAEGCTDNWVEGVANEGIFYKSAAISDWTTGVNGIPEGWLVKGDEFKFTAKAANSTIGLSKLSTYQTLEYSTDDETWDEMTTATTITLVNVGDSVYVRGILSNNNVYNNHTQFSMSGNIAVSGKLNYLWNYENLNADIKQYCAYMLFNNCVALTEAGQLIFPITRLVKACYGSMFEGCTNLTVVPSLPATNLGLHCYNGMFKGCTSLTTAPELPSTTLYTYCYSNMFENCTSLVNVPALPAQMLEAGCYVEMFKGCTSLINAPEICATILAGVPDTWDWTGCCQRMFSNCTSLVNAPVLHATKVTKECYAFMFENCTSLTTAPVLVATTLVDYCYQGMFKGCTNLTTAPELPSETLVPYCYQYMFKGCTNLNYIKCLATDISSSDCTKEWVSGVSATGTFEKSPDMENWTVGINGIPEGWKVKGDPLVPKDEIWYTSTNGDTVEPYDSYALPHITSNTYNDGKGIIKFETNLSVIGNGAFRHRETLKTIILPESITSIKDYAFATDNALDIYFTSKIPIDLVDEFGDIIYFINQKKYVYNVRLFVPEGYEEIYSTHDAGWEYYADCIEGYTPDD